MAGLKGLGSLAAIQSPVVRRWASEKSLPILLDHLMSFIADYQRLHNGTTPMIAAMANELMVSDQQIRFYLSLLEQEGRLHRYGQNPIRVMLKDSPAPLDVARRLTGALKGGGDMPGTPKERYEAVDAKRQRLGRFIGETWKREDRAPTLREMMSFAEIDSAAWVTAQIEILRDRGLIDPHKTALTPEGEMAYGLTKKMEDDMKTGRGSFSDPEALGVAHEAKRKSMASKWARRDADALEYMKKHLAETGKLPRATEVAGAIGMAPAACNANRIMKRLADAGLIIRNQRGHLRGIVGFDPATYGKPEVVQEKPRVFVRRTDNDKVSMKTMRQLAALIYREEQKFGRTVSSGYDAAEAMGFKSASSISKAVVVMAEQGFIERRKGTVFQRITLTDRGRDLARAELGEDKQSEDNTLAIEAAAAEAREEAVAAEAAQREEEERAQHNEFLRTIRERQERPVFFRPPTPTSAAPSYDHNMNPPPLNQFDTADLIMELIERGYVVKRS